MERLVKSCLIMVVVFAAIPVYLYEKAKDVYYCRPMLYTIGFVVIGWGLIYLILR